MNADLDPLLVTLLRARAIVAELEPRTRTLLDLRRVRAAHHALTDAANALASLDELQPPSPPTKDPTA